MLLGLCGLIGSGKGAVADILVQDYDFKKISFADRLKDGVAAMFGWDREMLEGDSEESRAWREEVDFYWTRETKKEVTPRLVLQVVGTECMREGFFDGIWISLLKQQILSNPNTNFVIPDVRFKNEIKMIKGLGGDIWRIKRGSDPLWFNSYIKSNILPSNVHPSEWNWANSKFDHTIDNSADLVALTHNIRRLLESYAPF